MWNDGKLASNAQRFYFLICYSCSSPRRAYTGFDQWEEWKVLGVLCVLEKDDPGLSCGLWSEAHGDNLQGLSHDKQLSQTATTLPWNAWSDKEFGLSRANFFQVLMVALVAPQIIKRSMFLLPSSPTFLLVSWDHGMAVHFHQNSYTERGFWDSLSECVTNEHTQFIWTTFR